MTSDASTMVMAISTFLWTYYFAYYTRSIIYLILTLATELSRAKRFHIYCVFTEVNFGTEVRGPIKRRFWWDENSKLTIWL